MLQVIYIKVNKVICPAIYIEENQGIIILHFKITPVSNKTSFQPVPAVGQSSKNSSKIGSNYDGMQSFET